MKFIVGSTSMNDTLHVNSDQNIVKYSKDDIKSLYNHSLTRIRYDHNTFMRVGNVDVVANTLTLDVVIKSLHSMFVFTKSDKRVDFVAEDDPNLSEFMYAISLMVDQRDNGDERRSASLDDGVIDRGISAESFKGFGIMNLVMNDWARSPIKRKVFRKFFEIEYGEGPSDEYLSIVPHINAMEMFNSIATDPNQIIDLRWTWQPSIWKSKYIDDLQANEARVKKLKESGHTGPEFNETRVNIDEYFKNTHNSMSKTFMDNVDRDSLTFFYCTD